MKSVKKYNYLDKIHSLKIADYCTSGNIDEDYINLYPKLSRQKIWDLTSNYQTDNYASFEKTIKRYCGGKYFCFGAGSEDLIVRINKFLIKLNDKVGILEPIFYRVHETLSSQKITSLTVDTLTKQIKTDYVWIANPNTLNGEFVNKEVILSSIKNNPQTMFIVDEASIFFLKNWRKYSLISLAHKYKNLIVLCSLSKFHGLSGERIGFACGSRIIIDKLKLSGPIFPVSNLAVYLAKSVIGKEEFFNKVRSKIKTHKKEVLQLFKNTSITAEDSRVNSIFLHFNRLKYSKLLVKYKIGALDLNTQIGNNKKDYIRLTIHSSEKRQKFLIDNLKVLIRDMFLKGEN